MFLYDASHEVAAGSRVYGTVVLLYIIFIGYLLTGIWLSFLSGILCGMLCGVSTDLFF